MATLTIQGKSIMGILKKIKEYPDYKKHLPIITSGQDVFTGYIDYYFAISNTNIADMLFIQTIMPFPGTLGNHDYMVAMVDPNMISVTYDENYYDFDSNAIDPIDTIKLDIGSFYKTIIRIAEYGCLNWGIPFRRYAFRNGVSIYNSGIKGINCKNDKIFTVKSDIFIPSSNRPVNSGNYSDSYDEIKILYIPLIHLNSIGAQLGVYPDELSQEFIDLLHKRKIYLRPKAWLTAKERRRVFILPYSYGQMVHDQTTGNSYISIKDDNVEELDNNEAWMGIDYLCPGNNSNIPEGAENPLETLLTLFKKDFDLSGLYH
jgi:hypothetical protein